MCASCRLLALSTQRHDDGQTQNTAATTTHNGNNDNNMVVVILAGHLLVIVSLFFAAGILDDANEIIEDDLFLWCLMQHYHGRRWRLLSEPDHPLLQAFFTVGIQ